MESMREIRNRMVSVRKTIKITNAMYLMASSEMKKARKRLAASEPYFLKLQSTITDILNHTHIQNIYFANGKTIPEEEIRRGFIVITSDRGLAGAYNHNVGKLCESRLRENGLDKLYFIGQTGYNHFKRKPELAVIDKENNYAAVKPNLYRARLIAESVVGEYKSGELNEIYVIYTKMKNALLAEAEIIKLLPMSADMFPGADSVNNERDSAEYEELYEPSPRAVLDNIVPNYVKGLIYGAMIEAYASEQNARMTAMDNATKNAGELVEKLSLLYNRIRQAAITTELAEVIGGASALEEQ
jgi:F-type H+-transporting ATPase subunit gamma